VRGKPSGALVFQTPRQIDRLNEKIPENKKALLYEKCFIKNVSIVFLGSRMG
jgi:hypothetical protein